MTTNETNLRVRLTPRSGRNEVSRWEEGVLYVRVAAPPVDGAANTALITLLSGLLGVPKSRIQIASGATAREKRVAVEGLSEPELHRILQPFRTERGKA